MPETKEQSSAAEEAVERWQQDTLDPALAKLPERKKSFQTVSLEEVRRIYSPADTEARAAHVERRQADHLPGL